MILEAFKPGEMPNDEYSVVDTEGNVVQRPSDATGTTGALDTGTGGLY